MMSNNLLPRKHKLEHKVEDERQQKKRCFSNLTNFEGKPSSSDMLNKTNSLGNSTKIGDIKLSTSFVPIALTQSNDVFISQTPQNLNLIESGVIMMHSVKKVLEHDFKDVSQRLQLLSAPPCLYDLQKCCKQHSQITQITSNGNRILAKSLLAEDRYAQFIQYVRESICGQKEFPGVDALRGILELILTISNEESQKLCIPAKQAQRELYSLFNSILVSFPVCHLRNSYLQLLKLPFKVNGISNISESFVLTAMLELLNNLVNDEGGHKERLQSSDQDKLNNFYLWDAQHEISFDNFLREDKIGRVLLVIDLVVRVLENDLAMFIIKYSKKLHTNIDNEKHRPLVCSALWGNHESFIIINKTIKNIISIFTKMVGLQYTSNVISRLLNLVCQLCNLYEYPDETFEYPSYKSLTTGLVLEIQKSIENSVFYSFHYYLKVAENLRSPIVRLLLTNQILQKVHNTTHPLSLKLPFNCILNKQFVLFSDHPVNEIKNDFKFPFYDSKKKIEKFTVTKKEYLKMLNIYATSLDEFYRIKEGLIEMKHQVNLSNVDVKEQQNVKASTLDCGNFQEKLKRIDLDEKVNLRRVDLNFPKLVHLRLSKEGCEFYRNEFKYFLLMSKVLKKYGDKYGLFDDWKKFIDIEESGA